MEGEREYIYIIYISLLRETHEVAHPLSDFDVALSDFDVAHPPPAKPLILAKALMLLNLLVLALSTPQRPFLASCGVLISFSAIFTRTLNRLWHHDNGRDAHGVCAMSSAKEFRDNAEECIGWARTARSDKERQIFLQMARTWIEAAEHVEMLASSSARGL
jgi:hypothetical protein